jgi:hypothetical protein
MVRIMMIMIILKEKDNPQTWNRYTWQKDQH